MKIKCSSQRSVLAVTGAILSGIILLAGCSTPLKTREVSLSGFLGDYSSLKPEESGEAKLVYLNPSADFSKYSKVMFEPVTVWVEDDSKLAKLAQDEVQPIIDYLDAAVRESLGKNYTFVERAGADVLRLRIAVTEGAKAKVVLNSISSVSPLGVVVNATTKIITGTHAAVGECAIEGELTDSVTGDRLMAVVDARAGRKVIASGNFTQWGDVQDAFDYWAGQLGERLAGLRN